MLQLPIMSSIPSFYRIPQEILDQILNYLEEDAPRLGENDYVRGQPYLSSAQDETQAKQQRAAYLESLSLVSRRMRAAVLDRMFLRLQLSTYPPPPVSTQRYPPRDDLFTWVGELSEIAAFVCKNDLGKTAKSFTLKIVDGQGHYHVDFQEELQRDSTKESTYIRQHWHRLLHELPLLECLTIVAPPYCLGVIVSVPLNPWISEILHMPYHLLSLGRIVEPLSSSAGDSIQSSKTQDDSSLTSSLLTACEWTSILLNEGSFIRWHTQWATGWEEELLSASSETGKTKLPEAFCAMIKSFEYIGIFPPPQSFKRLMTTLKAMPVLRSFSFQIQPNSNMLYDTAQRESASFERLQEAIRLHYNMVFDDMIVRSVPEGTVEAVDDFHELVHIQCLDQGSVSQEMWKHATAGSEMMRWRRDKVDGSLRKGEL